MTLEKSRSDVIHGLSEAHRMAVIEEPKVATLPVAEETCPTRGSERARRVPPQMGGADEPATRILECTRYGRK